MPRLWPRGLCDRAAAWVWQSWKEASEERAAVMHLEGVSGCLVVERGERNGTNLYSGMLPRS